ncbi:hypothetical protein LR48_Vigan05g064400 [Vigna angularis]|uniref:Uncharacterized protein n=1 Tax=Phaseolus angularis TaxID=3914 RepID=A0A0L9UJJ4_PHAAN|nr:hypothetical protein LR48_Vigan05g064400 [Vigna angularis]
MSVRRAALQHALLPNEQTATPLASSLLLVSLGVVCWFRELSQVGPSQTAGRCCCCLWTFKSGAFLPGSAREAIVFIQTAGPCDVLVVAAAMRVILSSPMKSVVLRF